MIGVGLFFIVWVIALAGWIVALVEVVRIPDHQYRAADTEKIVWVLVVVLTGIIGAIVWFAVKRTDVLAARGHAPGPAPGWYPEPGSGALRWWDGQQWTEARHLPPTNP